MRTLAPPPVAAVAGMVSFSSPCCPPLIPRYLSYVPAIPVSESGEEQAHAAAVRAARLFVAGFTIATVLGASFTGAWRQLFLPLQRSFARRGWPPV